MAQSLEAKRAWNRANGRKYKQAHKPESAGHSRVYYHRHKNDPTVGKPRDVDATEALISRMRPMLYAMAKEHVNDPAFWDECVQEAMIHVWKLLRRNSDEVTAVLNKAARRRMYEVSERQTLTAGTSQRGGSIDPLRRSHHSLDRLVDDGFFSWEDEDSTLALRCTVAQ